MKIYTTEEITKKLNRKKIREIIVKAIIYPIVFLVLICNIILVIQKMIYPNKAVGLFGYKAFVIASGSMEPTLEVGDIVITKKAKQEEIKKGDIITFVDNGYTITHRMVDIVEKEGNTYYQTKGDNNSTNDPNLVKYNDIEGIYIYKIEGLGNIINYAQNTPVMIIILIVLYIIYKIFARKDNRKNARHKKRKEFEKKSKK